MNARVLLCLAVVTGWGCGDGTGSSGDAGPAVIASSEIGAPGKPPALRVPHPGAPALPDLPALTVHGPSAASPAESESGAHPCRAIWSGSADAPLACARSLLFDADTAGGAVPLVSRKLLARDVAALPTVVDHRIDGTEGPVRDQGSAPACTAFATAAAIDHALARWGGGNPAVSVMQIWSRYHSPEVETSLSSNLGQALGSEQQWPFRAAEATTWVSCSEFSRPPRAGCGNPVNAAHARAVVASPVGEFTEVEFLGTTLDTPLLQAKLAAGQDVMVTMELPSVFVPRGRPGARYIPDDARPASSDSGHAVVLAGYARMSHGTYFLLRNSWGTTWGDGGYAWIHEATLRRWTRSVVAVDAEPVERGPASRPRPRRAATTCAGDLVPDSIRATCAPACPDHSPRHDGVCPLAGQCASGFVNLTGACVLAAPTATGRDPWSGASWSCGPGGCTYELPQASDPVCTGSRCRASCPAPDFILARMGEALVCVE